MMEDAGAAKLNDAATRLKAKGLLEAGDSLSMRLAGTGKFLLLEYKDGTMQIETLNLLAVSVIADGRLASRHAAVYQARVDVGVVVMNRQPWALALHALGGMPGVFDEQIRHLGRAVACLEEQGGHTQFGSGGNAFVTGHGVLCMGMTIERAVFNAELLEKCAKAFVLASSTGKPVGRIPWLVRWIANGRLMKDERHAAEQYANGFTPEFSSAY
jgi:ribulose-5-phosphate 4-epimerase/fuculose-1-phosphate aldolase